MEQPQHNPFRSLPAEAEESYFPRLTVQIRGRDSFSTALSCLVTSKTPHEMEGGNGSCYSLWYAHFVGQRGQGTTLQAVYAALVNNPPRPLLLDGVGHVMAGNHQQMLVSGGYSTHWTYNQQEVALPLSVAEKTAGKRPTRYLHGVFESQLLCHADPVAAEQAAIRNKKNGGKKTVGGSKGKYCENLSESTARKAEVTEKVLGKKRTSSTKETSDGSEISGGISAGKAKPLFLLLVPGAWSLLPRGEKEARLAQLYLSFLDHRFPLPLLPTWGPTLWHQASAEGEIEELQVWTYPQPYNGKSPIHVAQATGLVPVIAEAYLCRPDPAGILKAIRELVAPAPAIVQEEEYDDRIIIQSLVSGERTYLSSDEHELVEVR